MELEICQQQYEKKHALETTGNGIMVRGLTVFANRAHCAGALKENPINPYIF